MALEANLINFKFKIGDKAWLLDMEPKEVTIQSRKRVYSYIETVELGVPVTKEDTQVFYLINNEWIPDKVLFATKEEAILVVYEYKQSEFFKKEQEILKSKNGTKEPGTREDQRNN